MKDCDFIPASHHVRSAQQSMLRMRATFISMMIVLMVVWITSHHHEVSTAEAMLSDVATQRDQVEILLSKKADMERERATLAGRKQLIDRLEQGVNMVVLMSEISRLMPETVVLMRVGTHHPGLSEFCVRGKEEKKPETSVQEDPGSGPSAGSISASASSSARLFLTGVANEPSEIIRFAAALERSVLISRVSLQVIGPVEFAGRKGEKFEITCELKDQVGARP